MNTDAFYARAFDLIAMNRSSVTPARSRAVSTIPTYPISSGNTALYYRRARLNVPVLEIVRILELISIFVHLYVDMDGFLTPTGQ